MSLYSGMHYAANILHDMAKEKTQFSLFYNQDNFVSQVHLLMFKSSHKQRKN